MCFPTGTVMGSNYQLAKRPNVVDKTPRRESLELVDGVLSKPLRVYDDGIRVGCTFVSKEAIEFIVKEWNARRSG